MRIYARIEPEQYADYVDLGTKMDAPVEIPGDMPEVDPELVLLEAEATVAAIEHEASNKAKAARAEAQQRAEPAAGGGKRRRKPTPQSGEPSTGAASHTQEWPTYDLGDGRTARQLAEDSWDVAGQGLKIHDSFWGGRNDKYHDATVAGYIGEFEFVAGPKSRHTFAVEHEGHFYAARHTTVAKAMVDDAIRRRLAKSGVPRARKP